MATAGTRPRPRPRKRAEKSCETCRRRKTRCVIEEGGDGVCVLCKFHQQTCTFVEDGAPRKRRTTSKSSDTHVGPSSRDPALSNKQWRLIPTTCGVSVEEYDEMDDPSLLKNTLGLLNKYHCRYLSVSGPLEPFMMATRSFSIYRDIEAASGGTLRWVSPTDAFLLIPDTGTPGYAEERAQVEEIESLVRPYGRTLLDLYFRVVYPTFPVLHRGVYMEKYDRSPLEFSPSSLAVVYLLAARHRSLGPSLQDVGRINESRLEELARKCLLDAINYRPKLSTIQAGLQLLQYSTTNSTELTAQLINVAFGIGLHLDPTYWDIPDWEKGVRKRLSWALYSQDKWNSLGYGQPPLINHSHWAVPLVTENDFPEQHEWEEEGSSEVERGRVLFCQFAALTELLNGTLDHVLSIRAIKDVENAGAGGLNLLLSKAKPFQIKLKQWFADLPSLLSMEVVDIMKLSSVAHLHLAYISVEVALHRQILLTVSGCTDSALVQTCRMVACERFQFAIDLLKSLKPNHLSSFWYSVTPQTLVLIGTFGCYLFMSETEPERRLTCKARLREYRWLLKMNGESGANAYFKQAFTVLDVYFKYVLDSKGSSLSVGALPGDGSSSPSGSMVDYFFNFLDVSPDGTYYQPQ